MPEKSRTNLQTVQPNIELNLSEEEIQTLIIRLSALNCSGATYNYINAFILDGKYNEAFAAIEELEKETEG